MKRLFLFVFLPILLTSFGELLLKYNINLNQISSIPHLETMGISIALTMIICGGVVWVIALSKFELSFLYPFLSLNYVIILIGSQWILNEKVSLYRYISVVLIIGGLFFISRSNQKPK